MKILKGDDILVTKGKDRGKKGSVAKVFPATGKVLVTGINMVTKHVKPAQGVVGGIIQMEKPISVANVTLLCPKTSKPTRVGYKLMGDSKVRVAKVSGEFFKAREIKK